ncbi:MAG: hypothetical protein KC656_13865 [Myxococcales bacterium]|nr:hypothetical protein [Myxococcales bacterium]MCB9667961.1 hypothetical protein [Alphaproteobacteria bacterium]
MQKLLALSAAAVLTLSGCVVHSYDVDDDPTPVVVVPANYAPQILDAYAEVAYDNYNMDDIWYFEATVDDLDGAYDVISVWADVYDEYDGTWVESFELFPTNDPLVWYSDWLGSTTYLDPFYPSYSVDIVAYDTYEDYDAITILPLTY